ncbi:hypothetical protein BGZ83_005391 [Gryganskiella cystojenkinii]|nr:hypothetical protein BGZ83_005391 [Gryganskiella cystojenkinii]
MLASRRTGSHGLAPTTTRSRQSEQRHIQDKPGWLETLIHRPIRVECWACFQCSWLHRGQKDATPSDWTCPHCLTRQKTDKDGNILPVPEMFDGNLNGDTADHIAHSRFTRFRKQTYGKGSGDEDAIFCETCKRHQRVVYQLLSNYIPDENDDNYQAYYDDADEYRRRVEERYPVACPDCSEKVQKILRNQNYRFKSSLLNSTLSKSRGDSIGPSRKYPKLSWILLGTSWVGAHGAWFTIEINAICSRQSLLDCKELKTSYLTRVLSKASSAFGSNAFTQAKKLSVDLTLSERPAMTVITLLSLSIMAIFWDRTLGSIQVNPLRKTKTQWYYSWTRFWAAPLLALQMATLLNLTAASDYMYIEAVTLAHVAYLVAFIFGKVVRESPAINLRQPRAALKTTGESVSDEILKGDQVKTDLDRGNTGDEELFKSRQQLFRSCSEPLENEADARSWRDEGRDGGGFGSSNHNTLNWSPAKPTNTMVPSLAFGMYREPGQSRHHEQLDSRSAASGFLHSHTAPLMGGTTTSTTMDNRFHSRAYEPSPLANPSLITSMGLGNISLGELLGFPSAKFQPPENLFAHRSESAQTGGKVDAWSHRRSAGSGFLGNTPAQVHRRRPLMDDGDDEHLGSVDRSMDLDADIKPSWGSFGSSSRMGDIDRGGTFGTRGVIAPQRFIPPEPETGLEDNFFGVVKIVDDYLPVNLEPRTISARNLMLKKRMARRWIVLAVVFRLAPALMEGASWDSQLRGVCILGYIAVVGHATAFWVLDEYHSFIRWNAKSTEPTDKTKSTDPFEPTKTDTLCSNVLLVLLATRLINICSMLSDKALGTLSDTSQCVLDWNSAVVNQIWPWSLEQSHVGMVAAKAAWIQDSMIVAVLAVLIVSGAKLPTDKRRSKVEIQKPVTNGRKASAGLSGLRL